MGMIICCILLQLKKHSKISGLSLGYYHNLGHVMIINYLHISYYTHSFLVTRNLPYLAIIQKLRHCTHQVKYQHKKLNKALVKENKVSKKWYHADWTLLRKFLKKSINLNPF